MKVKKYLIYSREHNMWWKLNSHGYTDIESQAGKYTYIEASNICQSANISMIKGKKSEFFYLERPSMQPCNTIIQNIIPAEEFANNIISQSVAWINFVHLHQIHDIKQHILPFLK